MTRWQLQRLLAIAAIPLVLVAVLLVALGGGDGYTVKARFVDAGGLVKGAVVQVGGAGVGEVASLRLTPDGQAEVELAIDEPLPQGTRAAIRAVGQAGVANRFVELDPGPAEAAPIPDGGVIPADRTRPIVDLDAILDSFDRPARRRLQRVLGGAATATAGRAARDWNDTLRYLDPALSQLRELGAELTRDELAVERLLVTGSRTAAALASRPDELEQAVDHTATVLGRIAAERPALAATLRRAPALLRQARGTLGRTRTALATVRPALREARPVAGPLERVLRRLEPAARTATPLLGDVRALVPPLRAALRGLPPLRRAATPALRSTGSTLERALPVFAGLRPYAPDLVAGLLNSAGATTAAAYDANGHMVRVAVHEPGNAGALVPLAELEAPGALEPRRGLTARCPGAAAESAPDRSNPWVPDPSLCDPEHGP